MQTTIFSALAVGLGVLLMDSPGYRVLFFRALLTGGAPPRVLDSFTGLLYPALAVAFFGHFVIFYRIFRPLLQAESVIAGGNLRLEMGVLARALSGGIVAKIQYRWGMMALFAWLAAFLLPSDSFMVHMLAIAPSALILAFAHYAGTHRLGMSQDLAEIGFFPSDKLLLGVLFGSVEPEENQKRAKLALFFTAWPNCVKRPLRYPPPMGMNETQENAPRAFVAGPCFQGRSIQYTRTYEQSS